MRTSLRLHHCLLLSALGLTACSSSPPPPPLVIGSGEATVEITLAPFELRILDAGGKAVLSTAQGDGTGAYGGPAATVDQPTLGTKILPGWDGYLANEAPWRRATEAKVRETRSDGATLELSDEGKGLFLTLDVSVKGPRVRITLDAREHADSAAANALNKTSISFALPEGEHFFGLGERFASVDHRGLSLYSYAEEGALGEGENTPVGPTNPFPNGPSMTYFPVPFFLSSQGYGMHLDTTFRSELHLGSEAASTWRAAVNAHAFAATIYVHDDPLATLADYTEDTGRPLVPAPWVFGPRRRVGRGDQVNGVLEWQAMRQRKIPVTGLDDAVHFLPALSQIGIEAELSQWTSDLHAAGYKAMAYNNPYVAANHPNAAADFAYGKEHGYFIKGPDGQPAITEFISGKLLQVAAVDLSNPDAVTWFQGLLHRTLELGYDGWMHDFGEYTPRDAVLFDGRRGDEFHNAFPVLSAKAAHDLLEKERPGDYLFFVRSGGSGTQKYVPAVWGGDAEATFDETQGLPSSVRGGLNLSMTGVPYWGSDMTGFKCITDAPNDKEVFLRWVEFGAVSPIMMEQNACKNPAGGDKMKWTLWSDEETITLYTKYAGLHTRLQPYFQVLAQKAAESGIPISRHPFLMHPHEAAAWKVEDAYYIGTALYVSPVVRRGQTVKETWLPPGATYVDLDDYAVYSGGDVAKIPAPLGKLPLLLVSQQILPLLDPSIETLAPATDPTVVTREKVADRIDVMVALPPGGEARLVLEDGAELVATRGKADQGNPGKLGEVSAADIADCSNCFTASSQGAVQRLRVNSGVGTGSDLTIADVHLTVKGGPARRVRWDVLELAQ
jgi:alpha-glucosidase (family GH31 glycosyl hydrolase)